MPIGRLRTWWPPAIAIVGASLLTACGSNATEVSPGQGTAAGGSTGTDTGPSTTSMPSTTSTTAASTTGTSSTGDPDPTGPSSDPSTTDATAGTTTGEDGSTGAVGSTTGGTAMLVVAEELIVDLRADDPSAGQAVWVNQGTGPDFDRIASPTLVNRGGIACVDFNVDTFDEDVYRMQGNAPATLIGVDATRSVEVWAFNETVEETEAMVGWGRRGGPNGTLVGFLYGTQPTWGAVSHWGAAAVDVGWSPIPAAGQWHHLVYTFDGTTARVYADGVLNNENELAPGAINTPDGFPILIGAELNGNGTYGVEYSGFVARVRIHGGVLSDQDVAANFDAERNDFGL